MAGFSRDALVGPGALSWSVCRTGEVPAGGHGNSPIMAANEGNRFRGHRVPDWVFTTRRGDRGVNAAHLG